MDDKNQVMKDLQQEIELRKQGVIMVVRLVNKDELNILLDKPIKVIERFYTIVDIACQKAIEYRIIKDFEPTKLYILIPNNLKIAEKLAYSIYSQVQLYVDKEFPESYLKCAVQSIQFPHGDYHDVEKLLSLLNYNFHL